MTISPTGIYDYIIAIDRADNLLTYRNATNSLALYTNAGVLKWAYQPSGGASAYGAQILASGLIVVPTNADLRFIDPGGNELGRYAGSLFPVLVDDGDSILFEEWNTGILEFRSSPGETKWQYEVPLDGDATVYCQSEGGEIFFEDYLSGSSNAVVIGLDISGQETSRIPVASTAEPLVPAPGGRVLGLAFQPGSNPSRYRLFSLKDGKVEWTGPTVNGFSIAADGTIYASATAPGFYPSPGLYEIDLETGSARLLTTIGSAGAPVLGDDGRIYFAGSSCDYGGFVTSPQGFASSSGRGSFWSIKVDGSDAQSLDLPGCAQAYDSPKMSHNGTVYARSMWEGIYYITPIFTSATGPAPGGWPMEGHDPRGTYSATNSLLRRPDRFFPGVAHAAGANGTTWRSDLVLFNASNGPVTASVVGDVAAAGGAATRLDVPLAPWEMHRISDVVGTSLARDGGATVGVAAPKGTVLSAARTFNDATAGSFSQAIPASPFGDEIRTLDRGVLFPLSTTASPAPGFRTNLGFWNDSPVAGTFDVAYYDSAGGLSGTEAVSIGPWQWVSVAGAAARVTASDLPLYRAEVRNVSLGPALLGYASVVDNASGDASYFPMRKLADSPVGGSAPADPNLWGGGLAHAPGRNGTLWRSDLQMLNTSIDTSEVKLELRLVGSSSALTKNLTLAPGEAKGFDDVIGSLFASSGAGVIAASAPAGVLIRARTWNVSPAGTIGQEIPFGPAAGLVGDGESRALIALSQSADSTSGFRTNLGLANVENHSVIATVTLVRGDGSILDCATIIVAAGEVVPVDLVFETLAHAAVDDGYAVVHAAGGRVLAWSSVVDNRTGDAVFRLAEPMLSTRANGCQAADLSAACEGGVREVVRNEAASAGRSSSFK